MHFFANGIMQSKFRIDFKAQAQDQQMQRCISLHNARDTHTQTIHWTSFLHPNAGKKQELKGGFQILFFF